METRGLSGGSLGRVEFGEGVTKPLEQGSALHSPRYDAEHDSCLIPRQASANYSPYLFVWPASKQCPLHFYMVEKKTKEYS